MSESLDRFLSSLVHLTEQYLNRQITVDEWIWECDRRLMDLELYPPDTVYALGLTVGKRLENSPGPAVDLTLKMISSSFRATRAAAVGVIMRLARFQPAFWENIVRHLVTDEDWEVRELAARAFDVVNGEDGAAEFHTAFVADIVASWTRDRDERIRRAATQALIGYAEKYPEFRPRLLDMLDPLIADEKEYVRRSMVSTLRTLGRLDPPLVMDYLAKVLENRGSAVDETAALVLDHPFADRLPDRKTDLLKRIADLSLK